MLGDPGIARTSDGGAEWILMAGSLPTNVHVTAIDFQNARSGWAEVVVAGTISKLGLYRTTDGGIHWAELSVPTM